MSSSNKEQGASSGADDVSNSAKAPILQKTRVTGCDYDPHDMKKYFKLKFKYEQKDGDVPEFSFEDSSDGSGKFTKFTVTRLDSSDLPIVQYSPRPISMGDFAKFERVKNVKQKKVNVYKIKLRKLETPLDLSKYFKPPSPVQTSSSSEEAGHSDSNSQ